MMSRQLIRYAIVGLGSNILLYLAYLLLTHLGLGHKTAMTLLYGLGVLQTFLFNRRWTFGHRGNIHGTFIRYAFIYLLGYLVNFCGLYIFVDVLGFQHQLIQGMLIIVVALSVFVLQRSWVFNNQDKKSLHIPGQGTQ